MESSCSRHGELGRVKQESFGSARLPNELKKQKRLTLVCFLRECSRGGLSKHPRHHRDEGGGRERAELLLGVLVSGEASVILKSLFEGDGREVLQRGTKPG